MNENKEKNLSRFRVSLYSRFGEQVFNDAGTRLEASTMNTARYINVKLEEYKELESKTIH